MAITFWVRYFPSPVSWCTHANESDGVWLMQFFDLLLVAGVLGAIAIWNWANDTWAVSKLSLAENDGSLTGEELVSVHIISSLPIHL